MKIALIDQDGHTVKMSKEEIAACLKDMGNTVGVYILLPGFCGLEDGKVCFDKKAGKRATKSVLKALTARNPDGTGVNWEPVIQIRSIKRPDELYSRFTLWRKKRMGSKLLERKVMAPLINGIGGDWITVKPERVWLRLKRNESHAIYVS